MIKILYVDDEAGLLELGQLFLEMSGEDHVETAPSAHEALLKLEGGHYDAVISDYLMPGMDGISFLKHLRAEGEDIPFILFTGRGREEVVIEALNSGADFYLQKGGEPVAQFKELEHKIKEAVRRSRAEKALNKNESLLRKAHRIGRTIVWEYDWINAPGTIWALNRELDIFRLNRIGGELPIGELEACIPERERVHKALMDLIGHERTYDLEYTVNPADGSPSREVRSVAELEKDPKGNPIKVVGILMDITELKRFEIGLQQLNRELFAIKECNKAMIRASSEQELLKEVCRVVCEVAGYRLAWIGMIEHDKAKSVRPVAWSGLDKEYVMNVRVTWADDERGKGPCGMSIRTGSTIFIQDLANDAQMGPWRESALKNGYRSCIALPLIDQSVAFGAFMLYSEKINGFTLEEVELLEEMANDVAFGILGLRAQEEKRKAEMELRNNEEEYTRLVATIPDLVIRMDLEGIITMVNDQTLEVSGYSREEVIGRSVFSFIAPEHVERAVANVRAMMFNKLGPIRYDLLMKDGRKVAFEANGDVLRNADGSSFGIVLVGRDIIERKRAEEALSNMNHKMNMLSSITRHDLNNQLMVLTGYLDLLEHNVSDPLSNNSIKKAKFSADRINDMLQFTKLYEDIGVNAPIWQDIGSLIETVAKGVQLGQIKVLNEIAMGTEIYADPLIQKVLHNLMENAVRYGGRIASIRFSLEERDGKATVICEDDGAGIPADMKDKLFTRGFGKNHGFGLFLSREILAITGIILTEEGDAGKGAKFVLTIPHDGMRQADHGLRSPSLSPL